MDTASLQRRLKALGFDPGVIDGAFGRKTIDAIKALQKSRVLPADGIIGPKTLAALYPTPATAPGAPAAPIVAKASASLIPPWLSECRRKARLHEAKNRSVLMAWLRSDGKTLGDPAKLPWCGDLVETCLALTLPTEKLPANPYYARNWATFGVRLGLPALGCVLVFSRTGGGHVGFYEGEDASYYHVRGGNQSNAITVARLAKTRCIAFRWPSTVPLPTSGPVRMTSVAGFPVSTNEA
jgi:uncharacterized protein (TIGR02594 family)